jgi:hypothetical protein
LRVAKVPEIAIPDKLWTVIQATTGWFKLQTEPQRRPVQAMGLTG